LSGIKGDEVLASSNLSQLATGVPVKIAQAANSVPPEGIGEPVPGGGPAEGRRGGRP